MWLTRISISNPYFATVLMLTLVVLGLFAWQNLPVEEMPDIRFPIAVISTDYPGASPEVVESEISRPLEEAVNTISGIKEIRSYSMEGNSTVVVQFELSEDPVVAVQNVRDKLGSVQGQFRREIHTPVVLQIDPNDKPMLSLTLTSTQTQARELSNWVDNVLKKQLQMIAGVGDIKLIGGIRREIRIDIDPPRLEAAGLSLPEVADAIRVANQDFPAGSVNTNNKEWSVRVMGKLKTADEFARLTIAYRNGTPIRLDDIANVADTDAEQTSVSLVNGQPGIGLDIRAAQGANQVAVAAGIRARLAELSSQMPAGTTVHTTLDAAEDVKKSLRNVESTLLEGALLTVLIVFLFLGSWRSTVITGLTLPISLIGTLFAVQLFGFTLNVLTLMALSLSIGLLIDDAIVVRENIVRHARMGKGHRQAALEGTDEIGLAVLATTLTVIAVFLPVGFMNGIIGKFFHQFGLTVAVAVLISMLVSFTLDPMLSSIWPDPPMGTTRGPLRRLLDSFERGLDWLTERYISAIHWALRYRKSTLSLAIVLTLASFALVPRIGGEFMPEQDKGKFVIQYQTLPGSSLEYTTLKGKELAQLLADMPEIQFIAMNIGSGSFGAAKNDGSLTVNVGDKQGRQRNLNQLIAAARQRAGTLAGITIKSVANEQQNSGKPINIGLRGNNLVELNQVAEQLTSQLGKIDGVRDIESSLSVGDPTLNLTLKRDAATSLGIDLANVGNTLSMLLAGNTVSTWEAPDGENYDVRIHIPKPERRQALLDELSVAGRPNSDGAAYMIPLSSLIDSQPGISPRQIERVNMVREVTVLANIDGRDAATVSAEVSELINKLNLPANVQLTQGGQQKDMQESLGYALQALAMGVIFIYLILTAQFRSFTLPIAIMVALPLAFVGVLCSLFLFGSTLNMFSIIGIIMLMGLVAKNGILLVDFINHARREGMERSEAIIEAGRVRLRPILMTSLAMIFGMLPLALGQGDGSEINRPMAHAVIGGLITSTILTLIVLPVLYTYLDNLRLWVRRLGRKTPLSAKSSI
ncbi:efflux RND transporter permease subunit [Neisseriaceae bacterium TC5R-5]|nr:efflux RND transporter permease subunit [Neisseriaceae bacterium TC5R-5]